MIHCCSEYSEYDPATGACVVGDPALPPLMATLFDYDQKIDGLCAAGTLGREVYGAFFATFEFNRAPVCRAYRAQKAVSANTAANESRNFFKQPVQC